MSGSSEEEFAEEIRSHLAHEADRLIAAGMAPAEADAAARRKFGNVTRAAERRRESSRPALDLSRLRLAVRRLGRAPLFSGSVVVLLGLALTGTTLVFSALVATRLRPLPFGSPDALVSIWMNDDVHAAMPAQDIVTGTALAAWRASQTSFASLAVYDPIRLKPRTGWTQQIAGAMVDGNYFATLRLGALRGRVITADDDVDGAGPVAVLSHDAWQQYFRGDSGVIGETWFLNQTSYTIVGVMPVTARLLGRAVWVSAPGLGRGADAAVELVGRLRTGRSLEGAQTELTALLPRAPGAHKTDPQPGALLFPFAKQFRNTTDAAALFAAAIGLLALVALANLGTVFLVRALGGLRRTAISIAIGASARRIDTDSAIEGAILGAASAAVALVTTLWIRVAMRAFVSDRITGQGDPLPLTWLVVGVSIVTGVIAGTGLSVATHRLISRFNVANYLHGGGTAAGVTRSQSRWRRVLVGVQVALALVATVATTRLVAVARYLAHVDVGFASDSMVVAPLAIWGTAYGTDAGAHALSERVTRTLATTPGVGEPAIWATVFFPMPRTPDDIQVVIEGSSVRIGGTGAHCSWSFCPSVVHPVSDNLFRTFGIPIQAGRAFSSADAADGAPVVIISAQASRAWFNGESPVGRRIQIRRGDAIDSWRTIVGVTGDVAALNDMGRIPRMYKAAFQPLIFVPLAQADLGAAGQMAAYPLNVAVRARGAPVTTEAALRRALISLLPDLDPPTVVLMTEVLDDTVADARIHLNVTIVGAAAAITLLLAIAGIAGTVTESVHRRTRELGVRIALGCTPGGALRLVCTSAVQLLATGLLAGVLVTVLLRSAMARVAYGGVSASRPDGVLMFGPDTSRSAVVIACLMILLAGLVAAIVPARAAAQVDPVAAFRAGND
jgi:predicted permease